MRVLTAIVSLIAMFALVSCAAPKERKVVGTAGEAYHQIDSIEMLYVLPVEMPDQIHGDSTAEQRKRWQEEWPTKASDWLAQEIAAATDERVKALPYERVPDDFYYMRTEITYLDVGEGDERAANLVEPSDEGLSRVDATCRIYNARSGNLVAEVEATQGSRYDWDLAFESDMRDMGQNIGEWMNKR